MNPLLYITMLFPDIQNCPQFKRVPFSITFGITINKAQGQTSKDAEIHLINQYLSHEQLYVVLALISNSKNKVNFCSQLSGRKITKWRILLSNTIRSLLQVILFTQKYFCLFVDIFQTFLNIFWVGKKDNKHIPNRNRLLLNLIYMIDATMCNDRKKFKHICTGTCAYMGGLQVTNSF